MNFRQKSFFLIYFVLVYHYLLASSDTYKFDSLMYELKVVKNDNMRVDILNNLADDFKKFEDEKALEYAKQAEILAREIKYSEGLAKSLYIAGLILAERNDNKQAASYFYQAKEIASTTQNDHLKAEIFMQLAINSDILGNYSQALEYQLQSLRLSTKLNDKKLMSKSYNHMGLIYREIKEFDKCIEFHNLSISISKEIDDYTGIIRAYNNLGIVHSQIQQYDKAINYYQEAIREAERNDDKVAIATALGNIGAIYFRIQNYDKALQFHLQAMTKKEEIGAKRSLAITLQNIGEIYLIKGDYNSAGIYLNKGLQISMDVGDNAQVSETYLLLSNYYDAINEYKKAFDAYKNYTLIKDSIFSKENTKQLMELQAAYESEKQEKEIELIKKENEYKTLKIKKDRYLRYAFLLGFFILVLILLAIYRALRIKQKANILLREKNVEIQQQNEEIENQRHHLEELYIELSQRKEEIEAQRDEIENKNKYITDSIIYAQLIQEAVLISPYKLKEFFPESFFIHLPKDIVSGDFFWQFSKGNKICFAVVDCTGHGVPGAFMSIVAHNLLNQSISEYSFDNPAQMLDHLNRVINSTLHFNYDDENSIVRDGMDIALCFYEPDRNILQYAGAFCPVYHIRNKQLHEYKSDSQPIEVSIKKTFTPFTNHIIHLARNDLFYVFTDGIISQFGGSDRKKFSRNQIRNLLSTIYDLPMKAQQEAILNEYYQWKGNMPQIDDIMFIGLRIT